MNQSNRTALIAAAAFAGVMGFASARAETTRPNQAASIKPHAADPPKNTPASDAQGNFPDLRAAQHYVCVWVGGPRDRTLILKDSPKPPPVFEGQFFALQVFFDIISSHPQSPIAQQAVKRVTELLGAVPICVNHENASNRPKIKVILEPSAPALEPQTV
jgi:hypothetical protein